MNEIESFRGYVVEKRDKKTGEWVRCNDPINGTEITVSKLKEGHEYDFRVLAENINGVSEALVTERPVLIKNPFSKLEIFLSISFERNNFSFHRFQLNLAAQVHRNVLHVIVIVLNLNGPHRNMMVVTQ